MRTILMSILILLTAMFIMAEVHVGKKVYSVDTQTTTILRKQDGDSIQMPLPVVKTRNETVVEHINKSIQKNKLERTWTRFWNATKDIVSVSWKYLTKIVLKLA